MLTLDMIPSELPDSKLVRTAEVARWFGVNPRTITRWAKDGRFPVPIDVSERLKMYKVGDLRRIAGVPEESN